MEVCREEESRKRVGRRRKTKIQEAVKAMDRSRRQCDSILLKLCGVTPRLLINVITTDKREGVCRLLNSGKAVHT